MSFGFTDVKVSIPNNNCPTFVCRFDDNILPLFQCFKCFLFFSVEVGIADRLGFDVGDLILAFRNVVFNIFGFVGWCRVIWWRLEKMGENVSSTWKEGRGFGDRAECSHPPEFSEETFTGQFVDIVVGQGTDGDKFETFGE